MKNLLKLVLIISVVVCFYNFYSISKKSEEIKREVNVSETVQPKKQIVEKQQTIEKQIKFDDVIERKEKQIVQNNNSKNTNFNKQVATNRSILNKQFPGNYIDRAISYGNLARWNPSTFPLKVYIENNPQVPTYYSEQIKKAFGTWQNESENFITFTYTDNQENADIKCSFPENFYKERTGKAALAGLTHMEFKSDKIAYATITFSKSDLNGNYYSREGIYSIALHEIGHALGIHGHSINKSDIMYPIAAAGKISSNDINTLKLLYSVVPDISNKPFSEEEKNKFINTSDIMGEYNNRIDIEAEMTKQDMSLESSNSSTKMIRIADLDFVKKDYKNAIINYRKCIPMTKDPQILGYVYLKIALCYSELQNYTYAIEYANQSKAYKPDDNVTAIIADLYYKKGEKAQAKLMLENLFTKNQKVYNAYWTLLQIYMEEKDYDACEKLYEMGKTNFPDNPPINFKKN